jgi:hypothetical protein
MQMSEHEQSLDQEKQKEIAPPILRVALSNDKGPANRVDRSGMSFIAFWRGQIVYENGRVKRFGNEDEAYEFLARCDLAGRIVH